MPLAAGIAPPMLLVEGQVPEDGQHPVTSNPLVEAPDPDDFKLNLPTDTEFSIGVPRKPLTAYAIIFSAIHVCFYNLF